MGDKITMIMAKAGNAPCVHGSTYCRRCYGEQISQHERKAVAPVAKAPKKKK